MTRTSLARRVVGLFPYTDKHLHRSHSCIRNETKKPKKVAQHGI